MSASYIFSASGGNRQFWFVPNDNLWPVASNQDNDKGPLKGPFIHLGSGAGWASPLRASVTSASYAATV